MNKKDARLVLERFLSLPISTSNEVLDCFAALPGAVSRFDGMKRNFVFIPGSREDRVLLVAHADTVFDEFYGDDVVDQKPKRRFGDYVGVNKDYGIGADDRAGCAILWLLKDSGHSLLIVDGEEHGQIGSNHIKENYSEIFDLLNSHSYMVQFDRRGKDDYKVYDIPVTTSFIEFIEASTGYHDAGKNARTDIVVLCRDICGVNLSIGYYSEHTNLEKLNFKQWFSTLCIAEKFLSADQKRYPLQKGSER